MEINTRLRCETGECKAARDGRFASEIATYIQDINRDMRYPGLSHEVCAVSAVAIACKGLSYPEVTVSSGEQDIIEICTAYVDEANVSIRRVSNN